MGRVSLFVGPWGGAFGLLPRPAALRPTRPRPVGAVSPAFGVLARPLTRAGRAAPAVSPSQIAKANPEAPPPAPLRVAYGASGALAPSPLFPFPFSLC